LDTRPAGGPSPGVHRLRHVARPQARGRNRIRDRKQ
jgi:hypothetical protein